MSVKMWLKFIQLFVFFLVFVQVHGNNFECGEANTKEDDRIVGGRSLEYWKYPWFAAFVLERDREQLVCGGSLITKRHVVTAAHCYRPFFDSVRQKGKKLEEIYVVKLGVFNICLYENRQRIFNIIKVHIEEEYYHDLLYYDIALVELDSPADDFMPICLPASIYESNNRTNLDGSIIGLGKESSTAWRLPCVIKEGEVVIQTDETCRRFLNRMHEDGERMHDAFCAGSGEGKIDTCQGDSGGPLQICIEDKYMLLGLTSFGFGCARVDTYGVYTDVSHFLQWIKRCIGNEKYGTLGYRKQRKDKDFSIEEKSHENDLKPKTRQKKRSRQRKVNNILGPNILQEILNK